MGVLTTVSRAREDVQVYENSGQPLDRVTFLRNWLWVKWNVFVDQFTHLQNVARFFNKK
jgi:hypothetical protein